MIDQGNVWSDTGHMARKGKADKTPKIDPAVRASVDMSIEERRKRLLGLGMTAEEVDAHFAVVGKLGLEEEEAEMLVDVEQLVRTDLGLGMAPTAICTAHEPDILSPDRCVKCGKPLDIPGRAQWADKRADGLAAIAEWEAEHGAITPAELEAVEAELTDREKNAPLCAVMTPDHLAAVIDAGIDDARQSEKRFEKASEHPLIKPLIDEALGKAADDGPSYEPLEELWRMRLSILAKEEGFTARDYVTFLVRRQWVARGIGKAGR